MVWFRLASVFVGLQSLHALFPFLSFVPFVPFLPFVSFVSSVCVSPGDAVGGHAAPQPATRLDAAS